MRVQFPRARLTRAVVLLSGGLDSCVAAARAREDDHALIALAVDYGQRHRIELDHAAGVAAALGAELTVLPLDLRAIGGSALTADIAVPKSGVEPGIPVTYVPARNLIMLSLATALAEVRDARAIYIGVNALDYSGYPDCRPPFITAFAETARLGTRAADGGPALTIETPLIAMTKADIVREGLRLGAPIGLTWSCYDPLGARPCGACDSCRLRARGFAEAGVVDLSIF